jgi:DNA polymerase III gamma/tau subunit
VAATRARVVNKSMGLVSESVVAEDVEIQRLRMVIEEGKGELEKLDKTVKRSEWKTKAQEINEAVNRLKSVTEKRTAAEVRLAGLGRDLTTCVSLLETLVKKAKTSAKASSSAKPTAKPTAKPSVGTRGSQAPETEGSKRGRADTAESRSALDPSSSPKKSRNAPLFPGTPTAGSRTQAPEFDPSTESAGLAKLPCGSCIAKGRECHARIVKSGSKARTSSGFPTCTWCCKDRRACEGVEGEWYNQLRSCC